MLECIDWYLILSCLWNMALDFRLLLMMRICCQSIFNWVFITPWWSHIECGKNFTLKNLIRYTLTRIIYCNSESETTLYDSAFLRYCSYYLLQLLNCYNSSSLLECYKYPVNYSCTERQTDHSIKNLYIKHMDLIERIKKSIITDRDGRSFFEVQSPASLYSEEIP